MGASGDDSQSVVTFTLSGCHLAVTTRDVSEIVPNAWLSHPPRMPSFIRGVLNLGGVAVPVLALDRLLGLGEGQFDLGSSILVMKASGAGIGILVEHVDGVWPITRFQTSVLSDQISLQGCIQAQLQDGARSVQLLSWRDVLLQEEYQRLDQFRRAVDTRLLDLADAAS